MTFSFTHSAIANTLLLKHLKNITIKGIFEKSQSSQYSKHDVLKFQGINVTYDNNSANMHNKVFIIDEKVVVTGSFNPSEGGDENNDENVLIIEDEDITKRFLDEFDKVYSSGRGP